MANHIVKEEIVQRTLNNKVIKVPVKLCATCGAFIRKTSKSGPNSIFCGGKICRNEDHCKAFDVQRIVRPETPVDAPEVAISMEEACEETKDIEKIV